MLENIIYRNKPKARVIITNHKKAKAAKNHPDYN